MDLKDFARYQLKDNTLFSGSQAVQNHAYLCTREVLPGEVFEECSDSDMSTTTNWLGHVVSTGWDCVRISISCETYNASY